MILKIMKFKYRKINDGGSGEKNDQVSDGIQYVEGKSINMYEVTIKQSKNKGESETPKDKVYKKFTVDENKETERTIMVNLSDEPVSSVYVLNEKGDTIQRVI